MPEETVSDREGRRVASRWIAAICALSLVAKLALLAALFPVKPGIILNPDTATYEGPARALLASGSFSPSPERAPEPELNRTPGFPLLIAAAYGAVGERPVVVSVLNVLLSTATLALVGLLGLALFGARAAVAAVALLAVDPGSFHYSFVLLTETPFAFLVVLSTGLLVLAWRDPRRDLLLVALAGVAIALATHVRPVTYYFPVAGALLVALLARAGRRATLVAAYLVPVLFLVGGWQARNLARAGTASFTLNQQVELYLMRAAGAQALAEGAALEDVQKRFGWDEYLYRFGYVPLEKSAFAAVPYAEQHPDTASLTLPELARVYGRRGMEVLRAHPVAAALMEARGLAFLFLVPPNVLWQYQWGGLAPDDDLRRAYFFPRPLGILSWLGRRAPGAFALAVAGIALLAALSALAVRGALRAWPLPGGAVVVATLAYLALVTAGPSCLDDRYRVPLMPFLCLLAARGLVPGKAA
jgi:4-amino-4-deoxy-L-arabinose transferase-like glycosyltransferase